MKLDSWLREDHSLDAKLRVIERLCQAVNGVHDGGEALGALEPSRIEIGAEGRCDVSEARRGSPAHAYRAPDREGASLAAADIYAVGAMAWEMLASRHAGASPRHLAEVRPELDRELSNAVMACLEASAEWRPKDLTYLAQMAAARQKKKAGRPPSSPRAPLPPRRSVPRPGTRRPQRRSWPLLAALVLVAGLASIAGRQLLGPGDQRPPSHPPLPAPPASVSTPRPAPPRPTPGSEPLEPPVAIPDQDRSNPAPQADPAPPPSSAPQATPKPTPPAPTPPLQDETAPLPTQSTPDPAPLVAPPVEPPRSVTSPPEAEPPSVESATPPEPPGPGTPPVLTAVSPLQVKGPGKVLIDLHGHGFRPQHRARVLPVKKVPWGILVVRQKRVSGSLITVLLELTETVEPGEYALAVEDGLGTRTEPVIFEVTR